MNSQWCERAVLHRQEEERERRQPDREHGAAEEEIGHRVLVVDAGHDHPAAQHLGFFGGARIVVLGGVVDDPLRGLQA